MASTSQPAAEPVDRPFTMRLNNYIQGEGRGRFFDIPEPTRTGPEQDPIWEWTVHIDGVEYGRGQGRRRGSAKERAAEMAIRRLNDEGFRVP